MIIDVHTHAFPDALAAKALESLLNGCNHEYKPVTNLTVDSLKSYMDYSGVDISVVQPVVTRAKQIATINAWARDISDGKKIFSFGGVYPNDENYKYAVDMIADYGLRGIKLHPEYQDFYVDEEKYFPLYDYALSKGLALLFHAGYDPAFKPFRHSSPLRFKKMLDSLKGGTVILAHLGGQLQWDEVEKYLVGERVYLDTSMGFDYFSEEQFLRILKAHGSDKILFGSDSPWSDAKKEIARITALPISQEDMDAILYRNSAKILGLI